MCIGDELVAFFLSARRCADGAAGSLNRQWRMQGLDSKRRTPNLPTNTCCLKLLTQFLKNMKIHTLKPRIFARRLITLQRVQETRQCRNPGSTQGLSDLQPDALPTELSRLVTTDKHTVYQHASWLSPTVAGGVTRQQPCATHAPSAEIRDRTADLQIGS